MSGITTGTVRLGDIRVTPTGTVEMYDGDGWVPYERIPDVEPGPLIRGGRPVRAKAEGPGGRSSGDEFGNGS